MKVFPPKNQNSDRDMSPVHTGFINAAILLAGLFAGLPSAIGQASSQPISPATVARPTARPAPVISPEISADGHVTFRLHAPDATAVSVTVTGIQSPLPMSKDAASVWSVTTPEALAPDLYPYTFTVDGVKGADPGNNNANAWAPVPSGSLLFVPGKPWSNLSTQHGAVAKHSYQSAIIGAPETYYVYTPANYDRQRKQAYPVMVLLHGLGDTAEAWIVQGGANLTLDSLIADGKAIPMIVVIPAGYGNAAGTRGAAAGFPNFTQALIEEMLPQVLKQYNASTRPEDHAITGLSMGGAQSLLLINHTDQFAWIGSFSPGFDMFNPARTVIPSPGGGPGGPGGPGAGAGGGRPNGPGGPGGPVVNPALASATPAAAPGGGTILARQRELLASGVLDKAFPSIAATGKKLKLLYVTCGTQDDHLFLTRQFKDFAEENKIQISYFEAPDAKHAWNFWRAQLAEFAGMIFNK